MSQHVVELTITLALAVNVVAGDSDAGSASEAENAAAVASADASRCPLAAWRGSCRRMTEEEIERVWRAVQVYADGQTAECVRARAALSGWVNERGEAWRFEYHARDNRLTRSYVLAESAVFGATQAPAGIGFRSAILISNGFTIARIALHGALTSRARAKRAHGEWRTGVCDG